MSSSVNRTGYHAICFALVHHHGAEVADIGHGIGSHLLGDPFVLAHLKVRLGESREPFGLNGIDNVCPF